MDFTFPFGRDGRPTRWRFRVVVVRVLFMDLVSFRGDTLARYIAKCFAQWPFLGDGIRALSLVNPQCRDVPTLPELTNDTFHHNGFRWPGWCVGVAGKRSAVRNDSRKDFHARVRDFHGRVPRIFREGFGQAFFRYLLGLSLVDRLN